MCGGSAVVMRITPAYRKPHPLNSDSNGLAEGLDQCLRLAHLEGEDLTAGQGSEWCVCPKGLCHPCAATPTTQSVHNDDLHDT